MIAFIIPLIHPDHKSIKSYQNIFDMLYRTVQSIKKQRGDVLVVVICHSIPSWSDGVKKFVKFIQVSSTLFTIHHTLDHLTYQKNLSDNPEDTPEALKINEILLDPVYQPYHTYLSLNGMYHNKDKGLKYYLGLLYLFKFSQHHQIDYVGLVDGDDFFHHNLSRFLGRTEGADMFVVEQGYLLFSDTTPSQDFHVTDHYPIRNFSNICGSNRFFCYKKLSYVINRRLHAIINAFNLKTLFRQRRVTESLISDIMLNIVDSPNAWSILPNFLGTHRLKQAHCHQPIHPFQDKFTIKVIPFRAAIKSMHTDNHSYTNPSARQELVQRYIENGTIKPDLTNIPLSKLDTQYELGLQL